MTFRAGFVALVGRPNVGKSTLLNRLLGERIAIVSPRPQTTRNRILGVVNGKNYQLALFDTPGIHQAQGRLNQKMVDTAVHTLGEVDAVLFLVDAAELNSLMGKGAQAERPVDLAKALQPALQALKRSRIPVVLGLNKIDAIKKQAGLLPLLAELQGIHPWAELIPFSAKTGHNTDRLTKILVDLLPTAEAPLFPEEMLTDQAERQIAAEYIREPILRLLKQEVPYAVGVEVEQFDEAQRNTGKHGLIRIDASIWVERDSQKAIVIGKGGTMLKRIGTEARLGLEKLLGCKVFLGLHVRVEPDWRERDASIKRLGL